jgi:parvulin-like peptidyl-prolyl isomerase
MFRKTILLTLIASVLSLALLAACGGGKKDSVVAKVGKTEITLGDFNIAHKAISVFNRPPLVTYEDCEAFLGTIIMKEVMLTEAAARGFDKDPALLKESEQWAMEQAIGALYKEVGDANIEISVEELRDYYRMSRVAVKASHIQVNTLPEAEEIIKRLRAGEDFAKLAAEKSIDVRTASLGGEIGEIRRGQMASSIERVLFALKAGEFSEPVKGQIGYHILKVTERTEANMDDFENQRQVCASELRAKKRADAWNAYLMGVKASLGFEFDEQTVLWLNERLPEQGSMDETWAKTLTPEDRARKIAKCSDGEWTVGDFETYVHSQEGPEPFKTDNGVLIRNVVESNFINNKNNAEAVKRGLTTSDTVVRTVQRKVEERLVLKVHDELTKNASVTDEAVREEYEKQKETLLMPERARLQVINVKDRPLAEQIRRELLQGASFDELARKHNSGKLQEKAGYLELQPKEKLPAELQRFAFEVLKIGDITPVIDTPMGNAFLIAKLVEKDPEHPMSFEEAKDGVAVTLLDQEKDRVLSEWLDQQKASLGVKIYPDALNKMLEAGLPGEEASGEEAEGQS